MLHFYWTERRIKNSVLKVLAQAVRCLNYYFSFNPNIDTNPPYVFVAFSILPLELAVAYKILGYTTLYASRANPHSTPELGLRPRRPSPPSDTTDLTVSPTLQLKHCIERGQ